MYDDPCPKCGHRRKRQLMSTDPNGPSLSAMWEGDAEPWQFLLLRVGTIAISVVILVGLMTILHLNL